jgi:hypothetical protein
MTYEAEILIQRNDAATLAADFEAVATLLEERKRLRRAGKLSLTAIRAAEQIVRESRS